MLTALDQLVALIPQAQADRAALQAQVVALTAERDSLKAQLGTPPVVPVTPPPVVTGTVDLTALINSLAPGQVLQLGHDHAYTVQAGNTHLTAAGAKVLGDIANPIPVMVVVGAKGGGSGIDVQAVGCEIAGIQWAGPYLAIRASAPGLYLHDCTAPHCTLNPKSMPGLNALIEIKPGSDGARIENIGTPDQPICCIAQPIFCEANNCSITNFWGCSWNEQAVRFTAGADASNKPTPAPTGIVWNNVNAWSLSTKECATIREGGGVVSGGNFYGNLRFGQGSGTGNVTVHLTGGACHYNYPAGSAQNSQLDLQSGTDLTIDNWKFDQLATLVAENGHAGQQAISGSASSTVTAGENVTIDVKPGVIAKPLVSGAKVLPPPGKTPIVAHAATPAKPAAK